MMRRTIEKYTRGKEIDGCAKTGLSVKGSLNFNHVVSHREIDDHGPHPALLPKLKSIEDSCHSPPPINGQGMATLPAFGAHRTFCMSEKILQNIRQFELQADLAGTRRIKSQRFENLLRLFVRGCISLQ